MTFYYILLFVSFLVCFCILIGLIKGSKLNYIYKEIMRTCCQVTRYLASSRTENVLTPRICNISECHYVVDTVLLFSIKTFLFIFSVHNTLYLEAHCPSVRPSLIVVSESGDNLVDFAKVSVGMLSLVLSTDDFIALANMIFFC